MTPFRPTQYDTDATRFFVASGTIDTSRLSCSLRGVVVGSEQMDGNQLEGFAESDSDLTTITRAKIVSRNTRPALPYYLPLTNRVWQFVKRAEDLLLSSLLLLVLLLPLLIIACWIKYDSKGPIFFTQTRRGRDNVPFTCYKFRTMVHCLADADCKVQSSRDDPRVTRVGTILRKTSMDELPQIFNVLRGHMSLVGPRPHAFGTNINGRLLPDLFDHYMLRYKVKPGITGLAQVNGWRGILDTEEKLQSRLEHDLDYISNWSLLQDIRILFLTLSCVFDDHAF